jgi:hypothetical protein
MGQAAGMTQISADTTSKTRAQAHRRPGQARAGAVRVCQLWPLMCGSNHRRQAACGTHDRTRPGIAVCLPSTLLPTEKRLVPMMPWERRWQTGLVCSGVSAEAGSDANGAVEGAALVSGGRGTSSVVFTSCEDGKRSTIASQIVRGDTRFVVRTNLLAKSACSPILINAARSPAPPALEQKDPTAVRLPGSPRWAAEAAARRLKGRSFTPPYLPNDAPCATSTPTEPLPAA